MFGDFGTDAATGSAGKCIKDQLCPSYSGRRISLIVMGIFIMITQNLMVNLLVANFTATYNEIEGSSSYFWSFQRYEMIQEFVERPNIAPPLVLLWYAYEVISSVFSSLWSLLTCKNTEEDTPVDPFCRDMRRNQTLESKLLKWEHMKAMVFIRNRLESEGGSRKGGGKRAGATLVFRGAKGAGKGRAGEGPMPVGNLLEGITKIFGPETEFIEERFRAAGQQFARLGNFEERLEKMTVSIKKLVTNISNVAKTQNRINTLLRLEGGKRLVGHNKKQRGELLRQNAEIERARMKLFEEMQKQKHAMITAGQTQAITSQPKLQESLSATASNAKLQSYKEKDASQHEFEEGLRQ
ncbi:Transient receptor putative cation channel subfamily M member 2, partial [Cichlidogyrus casuarinus]